MFAEIILPFAISGTFTYKLPDNTIPAQPGMRVIVPFGERKFYTGIIYKLSENPPQGFNIKELTEIIDEYPIITPHQFAAWEWMANYYQVSLGEIYKAAIPAGLKIESETKVMLLEDFEAKEKLTPKQLRIISLLEDGKLHNAQEIAKQLGTNQLLPVLYKLVDMGAIQLQEGVESSYRPQTETYICLSKNIQHQEQLQEIFNKLSRSPQQTKLLMQYLSLSSYMQNGRATGVKKKELLSLCGVSSTICKELENKGILYSYQQQTDRIRKGECIIEKPKELNDAQQKAIKSIHSEWENKDIVLLHGVTSSGKTEVYIHLIEEQLSLGKQVLYLVPEIALTTQLTNRLQTVFGHKLGVYHSKFSDAERVEIYQDLLQQKSYEIILGVRSSIFLPFSRLGLIIVDEEHETSYKQQDPAPRYNARNMAIILGKIHHCKTLLGSATPSVETYYNATTGKYGLVEMTNRYKNLQMPIITTVDMKEAARKKEMTEDFSDILVSKIQAALERKEQVIIFQNRRGYAPFIQCKECGHVPHCANCDVSLTLHKKQGLMICHYCGYTQPIPQTCPNCHSSLINDIGLGTEKIEEEVMKLFPTAIVARMDLDTTRSKNAYKRIIDDFSDHKIDILIGTQMVSKGLSFDDVSLVAVLNADNLLNAADFRAHERAFQLLEQVSGRAGRMHKQGEVILQTRNPDNPIIRFVERHDYISMYETQLNERLLFHYPPFYRVILLSVKHRDAHMANRASNMLARLLQQIFGKRSSDAIPPIIPRVQNVFIRQIILKIESTASASKAKQLIQSAITQLHNIPEFKNVPITIDVDPM